MIAVNELEIHRVKGPGKAKSVDIPLRSDMEALRRVIDGPKPGKNAILTWSSLRVAIVLGGSCGMRVGEVWVYAGIELIPGPEISMLLMSLLDGRKSVCGHGRKPMRAFARFR